MTKTQPHSNSAFDLDDIFTYYVEKAEGGKVKSLTLWQPYMYYQLSPDRF